MKRYLLILAGILFLCGAGLAQNEVDALRFSQHFPVGTARSVGLGGAVGALGGDFTGLSINPAGIGLYRQSEFTISPSLYWTDANADFLGSSYDQTKYNFNIGNIGYVGYYDLRNESGWKSTSFGIGYNRINNFNKTILMRGVSKNTSFLDNFTDNLNNYPDQVSEFYEDLALNTNLIFYDTVYNKYYSDVNLDGYGQLMSRKEITSGNIGEYTFSFGANYNDRLYLGATFGLQSVRWDEQIQHSESDPADSIAYFDAFDFTQNDHTSGVGYNFKVGTIIRPVDMVRVGISYELPTFYRLNSDATTEMVSYFDAGSGVSNGSDMAGPVTNKYRLRSPSKMTASTVVTFGKSGLVSFDYERLNYGKMDMDGDGPSDTYFAINQTIGDLYRPVNNFRAGGELRLGTNYVRAGYAFYQSPFKSYEPNSKNDYQIFSAGVGVRSKYAFVDLSYAYSTRQERYYMYPEQIDSGSLNTYDSNNVILTLGFRF